MADYQGAEDFERRISAAEQWCSENPPASPSIGRAEPTYVTLSERLEKLRTRIAKHRSNQPLVAALMEAFALGHETGVLGFRGRATIGDERQSHARLMSEKKHDKAAARRETLIEDLREHQRVSAGEPAEEWLKRTKSDTYKSSLRAIRRRIDELGPLSIALKQTHSPLPKSRNL